MVKSKLKDKKYDIILSIEETFEYTFFVKFYKSINYITSFIF